MKLVDVNLLVYAVNEDSVHHQPAKDWLEASLRSDEPVALPWVVSLGFLRIATSPHVFPTPLSAEQALEILGGWLALPTVMPLTAGRDHWRILRELLGHTGTAANLTTDAHLAALAIEHGCELCSTDTDFGRFPHLRWTNPLR